MSLDGAARESRSGGISYSREADRASAKDSIVVHDCPLSPTGCTATRGASCYSSRRRALDIVVEAFDNIAGAGLLQIRSFEAIYLFF